LLNSRIDKLLLMLTCKLSKLRNSRKKREDKQTELIMLQLEVVAQVKKPNLLQRKPSQNLKKN